MKKIVLIALMFVAGCVGSPVHRGLTIDAKRKEIRRNHKNLLSLKVGLDKSQVTELMGKPKWIASWQWGSASMYRTGMMDAYSEADWDFTPVVFGLNRKVIGWGHSFYANEKQKHETTVPQ